MRNTILLALSSVIIGLTCVPAYADTQSQELGGDTYLSGSGSAPALNAGRDLLASGRSLVVGGQVAGDLHIAGFDVDVETDVANDVYAAGGSVTLRAPIGEDLSAFGFSLRLSSSADVAGNARLAGGTVIVDGAVDGALIAAGNEVQINGTIGGDVWVTAQTLDFGEDAKIVGTLKYSTPDEVRIPTSVISADKVSFEKLDRMDALSNMRKTWDHDSFDPWPGPASIILSGLLGLAFLIVVGAIFLAFAPKTVEGMRRFTLERPWMTLLTGVIGLSILFGLAPVSAMTLIGIPLLPFIALAILLIWFLGYLLGAYILTMRLWLAFRGDKEPDQYAKLGVLAGAVLLMALLNFVPILGWLINFALVLLGVGAMTSAVFQRLAGSPIYARDVDFNLPSET